MPIRRLTIHACVAGVALTSSSLLSADTSLWKGSYAADGQCFCVGSLGQEIDSQIIPTPVGGQSIAQVCNRVGPGPELQKVNGKFNFPVYPDYQCGHDAIADGSASSLCIGHLGITGEDCEGVGPKWDLSAAYSKSETVELGIADSPSATGMPRYITPPSQSVASQNDSLEKSAELKVTEHGVSGHTSVEDIAKLRASSTKMMKATNAAPAIPETREQLRARQLEHLAAARERAALSNAEYVDAKSSIEDANAKSVEAAAAVVAQASENTEKPVSEATPVEPTIAAASEAPVATPALLTAMQFPVSLKRGSAEFDFVEAAPISYDFGGAGIRVTASKSNHDLIQYVLHAAAVDSYQEVSFGMGIFVSPENMPRATLMLSGGMESGRFEFKDDELSAELSDSGVYMQLATRFALTSKLRLQAGVSYSSFFEGDLIGFGEALFNITKSLDLSTRVEAGDNDLLGFGFRYHY